MSALPSLLDDIKIRNIDSPALINQAFSSSDNSIYTKLSNFYKTDALIDGVPFSFVELSLESNIVTIADYLWIGLQMVNDKLIPNDSCIKVEFRNQTLYFKLNLDNNGVPSIELLQMGLDYRSYLIFCAELAVSINGGISSFKLVES